MSLKPATLLVLLILAPRLSAEEATAPGTPVVAVTPLTLIWLAVMSQSHNQQSSSSASEPAPNFYPGGSLYFGGVAGNRETLVGFSIYNDFFDLNYQDRVYWSQGNAGFFAGTFVSAEFLHFNYYDKPEEGMTLTNDHSKGTSYLLVGTRWGGNVGFRMNFGGVALTPRIGLTLPVFIIFHSIAFSSDDLYKFYLLNAITRSFELGLTLDFGAKG